MKRNEVGRFYATSFDDELNLEFIVYDDKTIDCPSLGINFIQQIIIRPRFVLIGKDLYYQHNDFSTSKKSIKDYLIDNNLFKYLKENNMIKYSTDMAYFYSFPDTNGYDRNEDFLNKPLLVKQKKKKI